MKKIAILAIMAVFVSANEDFVIDIDDELAREAKALEEKQASEVKNAALNARDVSESEASAIKPKKKTLKEKAKYEYLNPQEKRDAAGFYLGLNLGASMMWHMPKININHVSGSVAGVSYTAKFTEDSLVGDFGVRMGAYVNGNHRIYLGYDYETAGHYNNTIRKSLSNARTISYNLDIKSSAHRGFFGYDFLPYVAQSGRIFVGFALGYANLKNDISIRAGFSGNAGGTNQNPSEFRLNVDGFSNTMHAALGRLNVGYIFDSAYGDFEFGAKLEYLYAFESKDTPMLKVSGNISGDVEAKFTTHAVGFGLYAAYSYKF